MRIEQIIESKRFTSFPNARGYFTATPCHNAAGEFFSDSKILRRKRFLSFGNGTEKAYLLRERKLHVTGGKVAGILRVSSRESIGSPENFHP